MKNLVYRFRYILLIFIFTILFFILNINCVHASNEYSIIPIDNKIMESIKELPEYETCDYLVYRSSNLDGRFVRVCFFPKDLDVKLYVEYKDGTYYLLRNIDFNYNYYNYMYDLSNVDAEHLPQNSNSFKHNILFNTNIEGVEVYELSSSLSIYTDNTYNDFFFQADYQIPTITQVAEIPQVMEGTLGILIPIGLVLLLISLVIYLVRLVISRVI